MVVSGEVDFAASPAVDDAVAAVTVGNIELDLAGVTFMGSSGLASLLKADRIATDNGGNLVLRSPSRAVRELLDMTALTYRFTITDD